MSAIHRAMLRKAGKYLPSVRPALCRVGARKLSDRSDMPIDLYLCRSVIGQQLSGKAAGAIWGRVEAYCGGHNLSLRELIRREGGAWLRSCGVSGSKSRALVAIIEARQAGWLEADSLAGMGHERRSAQVGQIWGIGQWTCDMLSMFYFADPDVWPRADKAANRELSNFMQLDAIAGAPWEVARLFRPYRSYLAAYMWRIADSRLVQV